MRRIVPFVLVAVIAFVLGTSGVAARLLRDVHVVAALPGAATSSPTVSTGATAAPTATGAFSPATVTVTAAAGGARPTAVATASATAAPTKPAAPAAPLSLAQVRPNGVTLAAGDWTNGTGVTAQIMAPTGVKGLRAEVEARPIGQDFKGTPTGSAAVVNGVAAVAARGLAAGRYHWQARLVSTGDNAGPWAVFAHGAPAFGVQVATPAAPAVSSPTNPQSNASYATSLVTFQWTAAGDPAGIAGYSYRLDTDPNGVARAHIRTNERQVSLGGLGTGIYYFHVRALDTAGNWGVGATYPVHVDVTPPAVQKIAFSAYYFDPALENLTLDYKVTKVSTVTVGIYDATGARIRHLVLNGLKLPGILQHVSWDGRDDKGALAPAGSYSMYVRPTDRLGNTPINAPGWAGLSVTYKRIVISLSQQRLFAYDGPTPFLNTLVTTGNKELPTPTGLFHVMFGKSPFVFHSPWPQGSKFYYPDSPVTYALYFKDSGYYIHDSPWRTAYGPGTNAVVGTPGQNYTGTHGCVNVPQNVMSQLYPWATPGTPVQIIQ